ncbi:hypothetical protein FAM09_24975 [Niastella caeni]|uniref:DUF4476 domain-containing protein n=1 Tax=Niastella caeni TaxID=2569763 RepID=A0A4S8HH60_9BACT|nr:hypothetical protein [Niastella caeni]THU34275.1 hypothetical protein FAM09_24975 [Niastella caeni]
MKRQISRFAFMSNPYRVIKLLAFVTGLCIVSCTTALAQQSLFVYLQSENVQPFYVQMGDKVYSSSAIGHLVISGLADKTCNLEIGFPQHATQPQRFSIPLRNKDHGFQLIKSGSRGWALQDLQTDETIKPLKDPGNSSLLYGERKKDDAFATLMAAVVNDSSVLYTSIVKKDSETVPAVATNTEVKPAEKQPGVKTEEKPVQPVDSAVALKNVETVVAPNPPPAVDTASLVRTETSTRDTAQAPKYDPKERGLNEKPVIKSGVAKIQQQTKDGETKMVFVDSSESPANVVTVYISEEKKDDDKQVVQAQEPTVAPVDNTPPPSTTVTKMETKQEPAVKDPEKVVTTPPAKEVVEPVKKESTPAKDTEKPASLTKEEIAEQIKKETWRSVPDKKAATDTVTIILESRQMKKAAEEPAKPLYQPKKETQPVVKPATPDTTVMQIAAPVKPTVDEAPKKEVVKVEVKPEVKSEPVKPAEEEKKEVKLEPVKADTDAKKESEPVATKTGKEEPAKEVVKKEEPKPAVEPEKKTVTEPAATKKDTVATAVKPETQPAKPKTIDPAKPNGGDPEKKAETTSKLVMINSDCAKLATDNDVDKMRVKMLPENDLQKKLAIANKYFKTMCLYARQIKALSELFPTDETKYRFLELAYPFAADTANFKELHELLTEEMYVTKFKKLVRLQ